METEIFWEVLSGTSIDSYSAQQILPKWLAAYRSGDPKLQRAAFAFLTRAPYSDWQWPVFEDWRWLFVKHDLVPYAWRKFGEKIALRGEDLVEERAVVLSNYIYQRIASRQREARTPALFRKIGADLRFMEGTKFSRVIRPHLPTFDVNDWRTWPPYFPGDVTSVVFRRPSKSRRR